MTFPRRLQPEAMDDPSLDPDEHLRALSGLARLNRATGIAGALYRRIRRFALENRRHPLRVLDIASASGDLPVAWATRARAEGLRLEITGLDFNPRSIEVARKRAERAGVDVRFERGDVLAGALPSGFDVITCSLFCHHLREHQIGALLQSMVAAARRAVIVCDLERSRLNLAAVWVAAHALSRCPVVHRDARLSVEGALTREEFRQLAQRALARPVQVHPLPPCRFIATIEDATELLLAPAMA